jgi:O-antigen/teichoic acid export membrane protein
VTLRDVRQQILTVGRETWLLFLAVTVANASNYVFHVVVSRMLAPAAYGALGAVLAILVFLSVPLGAVQTLVAKRFAESDDRETHALGFLKTFLPVGLLISAGLTIVSPFLTGFLRLDSIWTALLVAWYVTPALTLTVLRGVLQGEFRFRSLALVSSIPMIFRLVIGVPLLVAIPTVTAAIGASIVAEGIGILCAALLIRRPTLLHLIEGRLDRAILKELLPIGLGLAAVWLLVELDMVLARRFLLPVEAGTYAAAGVLARAVLFVPGAVSLVALPHFSREGGRGETAHRWLLASSALVVLLGAVVATVLAVGGDWIMALTFGQAYSSAGSVLPLVSFAMIGMGLGNLLVYFHIAAGSRAFHLLWLVAGAEAVLIAALGSSGTMIATIVLFVSWVVALIGLITARSLATSTNGKVKMPEGIDLTAGRGWVGGLPEVSLIIPTYNGGPTLSDVVASATRTLQRLERSYELIVVSDGTTDGSVRFLGQTDDQHVHFVHYEKRHGKGIALRVGMTRARGRYVAFMDGDGDLNADELIEFLALMDLYEPDMVIGSKRHPLSTVSYPVSRRMMSWGYQQLVRILFGLNVRDTQTGMKLIRRDVLDSVLPRMLEKRYAFDLEFLVVARRLGFSRVFEAPVRIDYGFSSTISSRAVVRILLDTAAIFYRRYILRFYDYAPQHVVLDEDGGRSPKAAQLADRG